MGVSCCKSADATRPVLSANQREHYPSRDESTKGSTRHDPDYSVKDAVRVAEENLKRQLNRTNRFRDFKRRQSKQSQSKYKIEDESIHDDPDGEKKPVLSKESTNVDDLETNPYSVAYSVVQINEMLADATTNTSASLNKNEHTDSPQTSVSTAVSMK